jgi:hypothetical protein
MTTDASLLTEIGTALYGRLWQAELARNPYVGISERTMRRLAAGTEPGAKGLWLDLARLLETRWIDLREMQYRVSERAAQP